jgi:hypothetical protein
MYLTYAEYQTYGGTLDETTFNDYEFEASTWIDWYTFNRLQTETVVNERVKRCAYRLIQLAKLKADALILGSQTVSTTVAGVTTTVQTSSAIASQSNDGVSIKYNVISADEVFRLLNGDGDGGENLISETINKYLQGVKNSLGQYVLFRGFYYNE